MRKISKNHFRINRLFIIVCFILAITFVKSNEGLAIREAEIIKGTADFVVERAEMELMFWLLGVIEKDLCKGKSEEWFFNLCTLHDQFNEAVSISVNSFKYAVREDMENLPANILKDEALKELIQILRAAKESSMVKLIPKKIANNRNIIELCKKNKNTACQLYLTGVMLDEIKTDENEEGQIKYFFKKINDKLEKNLNICNDNKLSTQCKYLYYELAEYKMLLEGKVKNFHSLKEEGKTKLAHAEIAEISLMFFDIVKSIIICQQPDNSLEGKDKDRIDILKSAFFASSYFLKEKYEESLKHVAIILENQNQYVSEGEADTVVLKKQITFYLPILAELSSADTSSDVKNLLSKYASSLGTWRIKRKKNMVSVGSLVGMGYSQETLSDSSEFSTSPNSNRGSVFSVFAPIGVDLSFPLKGKHTFGVFLSIIDLGHLLEARYHGKEEENVDSIKAESNKSFEQVISPGIFARWGISKSPWVIGFGYSRVPKIRKVNFKNGESKDLNSYRWTLFVSMDITIFPMFTW